MTNKELINSIPSTWDELKLRDFRKIIDIVPNEGTTEIDSLFAGVENSVKVLSALTGMSEDIISSMDIAVVSKMAERLDFMLTEPSRQGKTSIKWKSSNKVSYNDYVTFLTLSKDPLHNLHTLIESFSTNGYSEEEILNLSMREVHVGFFTLARRVRKYVRHLILTRGILLLIKMAPRMLMYPLILIRQRLRHIKKH